MNNPITPRLLPPERLAEIEKLFSDDLIGKGFLDIYFVRDLLGHIAALERDRDNLVLSLQDALNLFNEADKLGTGKQACCTEERRETWQAVLDAAMRGGKETK